MTNDEINMLHGYFMYNNVYAHQLLTFNIQEGIDPDTCVDMALAYSYSPLDIKETA